MQIANKLPQSNFFEKRVSDYQKSGVMASTKRGTSPDSIPEGDENPKSKVDSGNFNFDEDF